MNYSRLSYLLVVLLLSSVLAKHALAEAYQKELDQQLDGLSLAIDDIEKDIAQLKKTLLFPPVTRLSVYVSMAPDALYDLHSVTLIVDNVEKSFHIYSDRDVASLRLGGIQRFFEGNVTLGWHKVKAVFKGFDAKKKPLSETVNLTFEKKLSGHAIELAVSTTEKSESPYFLVKDLGAE